MKRILLRVIAVLFGTAIYLGVLYALVFSDTFPFLSRFWFLVAYINKSIIGLSIATIILICLSIFPFWLWDLTE